MKQKMRAESFEPRQVSMLVQGSEVYGIGTIEKLYATAWPDLTFVCLGRGALHDWLVERGAVVELVEGLTTFRARNSFLTLARIARVMALAKRDAMRIHERIAARGIRVVHAHWRPQQLIAGQMRQLGYRTVWQINNNMSRRRLGGLGRWLNHRLARWGANLLLPASDFIAQNWRGCGVPMRTVRNAAAPLFQAPSALPLDGPLRCMVAGRLLADKGHHVAVAAVLAARQAGCDVELDIFGGPLENNRYADQLRQTIRTAGNERQIRLAGFCDDLRQKHRDYHLGLQCRISPEPCSLWVCETLVDGLPLVASATGGTPELVEDGVTGFLFAAGSADELADRIVKLARQRELLAQMRVAAFERGQRHFVVRRFLDETLKAYALLPA
jgi:glycosyltransferase involved in cell wall biosynthesis